MRSISAKLVAIVFPVLLAGCAAGMTVFGFAGLTAPAKLIDAGAALVLSHMRELPALLL